MGKRLLVKGGRVIDPLSETDEILDVLIEDGKIKQVARDIPEKEGTPVLDARGKVVMPGFIDMHVHLREPGQEYKEDIESGTKAAAAGGFTAVACMPNTEPAVDNDSVVSSILRRAREVGVVRVYPVGAVTKGRGGKELAEMGQMRQAGAVAFSDDGSPVATGELLRCALEYLKSFDCTLIDHPEDLSLSEGGVMNQGLNSTLAGFRGIPNQAEEVAVARDITMARLTGGRLHLTHISTKEALGLIKQARANGINLTCDVTPHHLFLTDQAVLDSGYDTNTRVNPPLRSQEDTKALVEAVIDGCVDAIATDHAPHHVDDKWVEYEYAAMGISGIETAVSLVVDRLVQPGHLSWLRLAELMSTNPAKILGVPGGSLKEGSPGDITVVDPHLESSVDPRRFLSKGKNTPFTGWRLLGGPWATIVGGEVVMHEGTVKGQEA